MTTSRRDLIKERISEGYDKVFFACDRNLICSCEELEKAKRISSTSVAYASRDCALAKEIVGETNIMEMKLEFREDKMGGCQVLASV